MAGSGALDGARRAAPRLSTLAQQSVRPTTQKRYVAALLQLLGWLAVRVLPRWDAGVWDEHLTEFLTFLYDSGAGPFAARLIMSAVLWAEPQLGSGFSRVFPLTHQAAKGWSRLRPPRSRPPIPWLVAAGMAHWLLCHGHREAALCIVVLFHTYCRPGEGLSLLCKQVVPAIRGQPGAIGQVSIVLNPEELGQPSKTGLFDSAVAFDLPQQAWIARVLLLVKGRRHPDERLLQVAYLELLAAMRDAADALGCALLRPTPHGLRHGGASHDKAAGYRSLLDIQARGKWRATQSVLRYEKHARIVQQLERLGPAVLQDLRSREACLPSAFSASFGRR